MRARKRVAFSLIEALVVIGILALLMALMLPAVQRARDAASRIACANNLRQLALAAHQYHDVHGSLPAGVRWRNGTDSMAYMSWLAQLLPFVEQEGLWARTEAAYALTQGSVPPYFPATGPHAPLFATALPVFSCPADGRAGQTQTCMIGGTLALPVGLTNYLGVNGTNFTRRDGVLFQDSRVRMTDIGDGTSQTLLVGERPPSAGFDVGWWYAGAGEAYTGSTEFLLGVQELVYRNTPVPCGTGPYIFRPGRLDDMCDIFHFWSLHVGGANFAFADGAVRFLPYTSVTILPALATRNGGEVVAIPD